MSRQNFAPAAAALIRCNLLQLRWVATLSIANHQSKNRPRRYVSLFHGPTNHTEMLFFWGQNNFRIHSLPRTLCQKPLPAISEDIFGGTSFGEPCIGRIQANLSPLTAPEHGVQDYKVSALRSELMPSPCLAPPGPVAGDSSWPANRRRSYALSAVSAAQIAAGLILLGFWSFEHIICLKVAA